MGEMPAEGDAGPFTIADKLVFGLGVNGLLPAVAELSCAHILDRLTSTAKVLELRYLIGTLIVRWAKRRIDDRRSPNKMTKSIKFQKFPVFGKIYQAYLSGTGPPNFGCRDREDSSLSRPLY